MDAERVPCPFCAEAIQPAATACPFCGRELTGPRRGQVPTADVSARRALAVLMFVVLAGVLIALIATSVAT